MKIVFAILVALSAIAGAAHAQTPTPTCTPMVGYSGSCVDGGKVGAVTPNPWTNPGNAGGGAAEPDGSLATNSMNANQETNYLRCTSVTNLSSLAGLSAVQGIRVTRYRKCNSVTTYYCRDKKLWLTKDGTTNAGSDYGHTTTNWTTTLSTDTYGGPTDLWGTTWTDDQVRSTNFGAIITNTNTGAIRTSYDDYFKFEVWAYPVTGTPTATPTITNTPLPTTTPIATPSCAAALRQGQALMGGNYIQTTIPTNALGGDATFSIAGFAYPGSGSIATQYVFQDAVFGTSAIYLQVASDPTPNSITVKFRVQSDATHSRVCQVSNVDPANLNQWWYVAGTWDGTTVGCYLTDPTTNLLNSNSGSLTGTGLYDPGRGSFVLGWGGLFTIGGTLQDVRIYNYTIGTTEVTTNCQGACNSYTANLIARYRLDDGMSPIAYDSGPSGYYGFFLNNGGTTPTPVPTGGWECCTTPPPPTWTGTPTQTPTVTLTPTWTPTNAPTPTPTSARRPLHPIIF